MVIQSDPARDFLTVLRKEGLTTERLETIRNRKARVIEPTGSKAETEETIRLFLCRCHPVMRPPMS
jgi:hypothetical protein